MNITINLKNRRKVFDTFQIHDLTVSKTWTLMKNLSSFYCDHRMETRTLNYSKSEKLMSSTVFLIMSTAIKTNGHSHIIITVSLCHSTAEHRLLPNIIISCPVWMEMFGRRLTSFSEMMHANNDMVAAVVFTSCIYLLWASSIRHVMHSRLCLAIWGFQMVLNYVQNCPLAVCCPKRVKSVKMRADCMCVLSF